jgi:4-amino-4-deoxy-L-arabinose transferase-like glycosyltransferase
LTRAELSADAEVGNRAVYRVPLRLLIVAGILRFFFFFIADNNGGDAIARAATIQEWMNHPSFLSPAPQWGAVYFYLAGAVGYLTGSAEFAGRFLSLISGIASILLVHRLAFLLQGEQAAELSALVCTLSGLHIGYSTTSSSEMLYLFFLLVGLWGLFEYFASSRLWPLVVGGISFTVSAGIRYEAWIFLPFVCILLVGSFRNLLSPRFWGSRPGLATVLFVFLAGAWPIAWTTFSWLKLGDPFYGIHYNQASVSEQLSLFPRSRLYMLSLPIGVLLLGLSPLPFAGAASAVLRCWKQPLPRRFLLLTLSFAALQYFHIWRGGTLALGRYTLTLAVLCAVLSGIGLVGFSRWASDKTGTKLRNAVLLSLLLMLGTALAGSELRNPLSEKMASVSPRLRYPRYLGEAARALKPRLRPNEAIIIDNYHWDGNIFAHALGLPLVDSADVFFASPSNLEDLDKFVTGRRPHFLIYAERGGLQPYFNLGRRCTSGEQAHGMNLSCLYANEVYRIYSIDYP